MENETIELITQLTDKVEQLGGNLFEIAMKQQQVCIIQDLLILISCVLCFCYLLTKVQNAHKQWKEDKDDATLLPICFGLIILGIIILLTGLDLIQWIINPEYASLIEITKLVNLD